MKDDVQFPKNRAGVCLLCNDPLSIYDSKYLGLDGTIICTAHRVANWQARNLDFKTYKFWSHDNP